MRQLKLLKITNKETWSQEEKNCWIQVRSDSNFTEFSDQEIIYLFQIVKQYDYIENPPFVEILKAGIEGMLKAKAKLSSELKPHKRTIMLVEYVRHSIVVKLIKV